MNDNTINNDMTMGGATGTLLAGRYRVVRQLGQGGMGSVWLAEDEKLDGFKVAIKMLPSVLVNNKRAYAQVKAEALVSLKLSHPNIATVRAFEEENGSPFLVMDYIDGQTLDDYLAEKGKLTEEETVELLKPVAAALDYAHTQGVVHRDVKPGNIMIRKDGTPFVLDFGIAREIQETMTRVTGKLSSGTLMYMSPEQLHGAAPKPAQDIYSFAAMAYECLKGEPPFSRGQIEYQIEHDTPENLGPQFANCGPGVMAGLAKSPEARPATCAAVLSRVTARTRMSAADEEKSAGKIRIAMVLLGVLVLAVLAGGGWWFRKTPKDAEVAQKVEVARQHGECRRPAEERRTVEKKHVAEEKRRTEEIKREGEVLIADDKDEAMRKADEDATADATTAECAQELIGRRPGEVREFRLTDKVTMKFCWCPPCPEGFLMGSVSAKKNSGDQGKQTLGNLLQNYFFVQFDETQHLVKLTKGFWIGQFEVSQGQWKGVMGDCPAANMAGDDWPVESVTWNDCQKFIQAVNAAGHVTVSLPTEAQWEYACRAGTATTFSFGAALSDDQANYAGAKRSGATGGISTVRRGSYEPNGWNIYDMHGNVWEWCADGYDNVFYTKESAKIDPLSNRTSGNNPVIRGGCWNSTADDCRSAKRAYEGACNSNGNLGFRLVCVAYPRSAQSFVDNGIDGGVR